ncbi:MAG: AmmeMemoRadiSam system protein B [Gammaproteobacteria bacterium]|nr:AmmeMemoRadiSam system protein B [Gammaproteobacteria bacterium]
MQKIRKPAVAGLFYPADPKELRNLVLSMLAHAKSDHPIPKAIIAPHAGYMYSGPTAAKAYACLSQATSEIKRVVILGPAHRYSFQGIAAPQADSFNTPLGLVKVDHQALESILPLPQVSVSDEAHALEHSIEVQLPFLQVVLKEFSIIPLVVGTSNAEQVSQVLDLLWGKKDTLIVISSDLSHYHDYETAMLLDKRTAQAILNYNHALIKSDRACGCQPILGLLLSAASRKLRVSLIDLTNSGDTAGPKDKVVGYGAFHIG